MRITIPFYKQKTLYTCGPASLRMVFAYFGNRVSEKELSRVLRTTKKSGTSNTALVSAATKAGYKVFARDGATLYRVRNFIKAGLPVIVNFREPRNEEFRFAVITGLTRKTVIFNDPWNGENYSLPVREFAKRWYGGRSRRWVMVVFNTAKKA